MADDIAHKFELETLESFDPKVFEGDDAVPQEVCNFVLTLALIFNDLKNLLYANAYLQNVKPEGDFKINRGWGNYGGITNHFNRNMIGLVREIQILIQNNLKAIEHPFIQSIINKLDIPSQEAWKSLIESSQGKPSNNQIGKFLVCIRSQVIFHYEPKSIYGGYKQFFSSGVKAAERAYISRGGNMAKTRYYFADAAVTGCFERYKKDYQNGDIFFDTMSILDKLNFALMDIINNFIIKRGFSFRSVHEEI